MKMLLLGAAAVAATALAASLALAQPAAPPAKARAPRNLQVLPQDIPQPRLFDTMRTWSQSLGVQCSHCHVPGNFAADDNPNKNKARGMVRMTAEINTRLLPPIVGSAEAPRITCHSCHRGAAIPETRAPVPTPPRG